MEMDRFFRRASLVLHVAGGIMALLPTYGWRWEEVVWRVIVVIFALVKIWLWISYQSKERLVLHWSTQYVLQMAGCMEKLAGSRPWRGLVVYPIGIPIIFIAMLLSFNGILAFILLAIRLHLPPHPTNWHTFVVSYSFMLSAFGMMSELFGSIEPVVPVNIER